MYRSETQHTPPILYMETDGTVADFDTGKCGCTSITMYLYIYIHCVLSRIHACVWALPVIFPALFLSLLLGSKHEI